MRVATRVGTKIIVLWVMQEHALRRIAPKNTFTA